MFLLNLVRDVGIYINLVIKAAEGLKVEKFGSKEKQFEFVELNHLRNQSKDLFGPLKNAKVLRRGASEVPHRLE